MLKLYYFDIPGKAEAIRLLLTHAGMNFEDVRFQFADWPKYKEKFELKQVPVLEMDGRQYCQSIAILEFLGLKYGYLPKKDFTKISKIMFVVSLAEDIFNKVFPIMWPGSFYDPESREEALKNLLDQSGPIYMKAIEKRLKDNSSQKFIVGKKYTIADFALIGLYRTLQIDQEWNKAFADRIKSKYPLAHAYAETRIRDYNPLYKKCDTRLYYFDMPGRAEMIRITLKHLGQPYTDVRIKPEDWKKEKTSGNFELQQLPAVKCDACAVSLCQTDAIMHRIGARFQLLPLKKPEKTYKVLWWCNTGKDVMDECYKFSYAPVSEDKKKEMRTRFFENAAPVFLQAMEERLKGNKSQDYVVGRKYTIGDFYLVGVYRAILKDPNYSEFNAILEKCPTLKAYLEKKDKEL